MATLIIITLTIIGIYISYIAWDMLCEVSGNKHYPSIYAFILIAYTTFVTTSTIFLPLLYFSL